MNTTSLKEDDLHLIFKDVVTRVQKLALTLEARRARVKELRRRLGLLRSAACDQWAATERGRREALMEKIRSREADRAIRTAEASAAAPATSTAAARQERDAARQAVVQLTLRVEILSVKAGAAGAALREQYSRLATLIDRLSEDLGGLDHQHRDLLAHKAALDKHKSPKPSPKPAHDLKQQLEARWLHLAVCLDSQGNGQPTSVGEKFTQSVSRAALMVDSDERLHFLNQFILDLEEAYSVIER